MRTVLVTHPSDKLASYFGDKAMRELAAIAAPRYNPLPREWSLDELVAASQGCDAVIAYRQTAAPEALFEALPQLAVLLRCAVDIRTIDVAAAGRHGVLVTQASAGFVPAVAEWIVGAMIELGRGLGRYAAAYQRGESPAPVMGRELRGATLGVIGFGQISRYLCQLASAFGMRVLVATPETIEAAPPVQQVPMPALLAESDFVVCLAPAIAQTDKLMNAASFAAMRPGSFFINASRGELVDDDALHAALDSGHLAGCALDVGRAPDQMPTPSLAVHPRVLATPHIGGLTVPATEHQALETVAQLASLQAGTLPAGAVNPEQATRWRRWAHAPVITGRVA